MSIALFLMTKKGYMVLESIVKNNLSHLIETVVIGEDSHIDNDFSKEIMTLCINNNISYYFRKQDYKIEADYALSISWRWIIKDLNSKLIVLHDSLLPKYRGFAPLVNMLINGETKLGVTAIFATEQYDEGDIINQAEIDIVYPIKIKEAITLILPLYSSLVIAIFNKIEKGNEITSSPQNHKDGTYSLWRDENDYEINWNWNNDKIIRAIDALGSPYKGALSLMNNEKIRILTAEVVPNLNIENRDIGKVIMLDKGFPIVVCEGGLIKITEAVYDQTNRSIFPLKKFRTRFHQ